MAKKYTIHAAKPTAPAPAPVKQETKKPEHIHARIYRAANWFTSEGVYRKRREIEAKGLPNFHNWRFITLTIDHELYSNPLAAYLHVSSRIRHFMATCRKNSLWSSESRWCWKLEFHQDGWPHWHLLIERTAKFSEAELATLRNCWRFGRTNVQCVTDTDFAYSFKYAFKPVIQSQEVDMFESSSYAAPDWFLDYYHQEPGEKPKTFARVRFWQTSKGFYTNNKQEEKTEKKPSNTSILPRPVRQVLDESSSKAQVIARNSSGKYIKSAIIILTCTFAKLSTLACWHAIGNTALVCDIQSYVLPVSILNNNTNQIQQCQLQHIQSQNKLTLKKAQNLIKHQTFNRC